MEIMKQLSRELMALWRENTEPDMRVNSVTGKEAGHCASDSCTSTASRARGC